MGVEAHGEAVDAPHDAGYGLWGLSLSIGADAAHTNIQAPNPNL